MNVSSVTSKPVTADGQYPAATPLSKSTQATNQSSTTTTAESSTVAPSSKVTISSAARAALAEATETAQQTAQEAQSGDRQAIKLLAKQAESHPKH